MRHSLPPPSPARLCRALRILSTTQFTFQFKKSVYKRVNGILRRFFTTITSPENQSLKHKFAHKNKNLHTKNASLHTVFVSLHTTQASLHIKTKTCTLKTKVCTLKMQVCTLIFKNCLRKKTSGKRLSLTEVFFLYANLFVRLFYAIFLSLELTTRTLCCFMYSVHFM